MQSSYDCEMCGKTFNTAAGRHSRKEILQLLICKETTSILIMETRRSYLILTLENASPSIVHNTVVKWMSGDSQSASVCIHACRKPARMCQHYHILKKWSCQPTRQLSLLVARLYYRRGWVTGCWSSCILTMTRVSLYWECQVFSSSGRGQRRSSLFGSREFDIWYRLTTHRQQTTDRHLEI